MESFDLEPAALDAIRTAARQGRIVNFASPNWFAADHPVTDVFADGTSWSGVCVRADSLREVILELAEEDPVPGTPRTHAHGIQIRGLRVVGPLDLYNIRVGFPLRFQHCRLDDTIYLGHARLETLEISQSRINALAGRGVRINGNLKMHYSRSAGPVVLEGASIRGWADLWGVTIMADGPGIAASETRTDLPERLRAHYEEENAHALLLRVAHIGNDLRLTDMVAGAPIHMEELTVGKRLFLDRAKVAGRRPTSDDGQPLRPDRYYAVKGGGLKVMGNAALSGTHFAGEVRLTGARIEGSLRLIGTRIHSRHSRSLMIDRAHIGGDLQFGDIKPNEPRDDGDEATETVPRTVLEGAVRMRKVEINGDLNLSRSVMSDGGYPNGFALRATGAEIQGELIALDLAVTGTFDLANATVRRKIRLFKSSFEWARKTQRELNAAFEANHLQVASDLVIESCRFDGPLYLQDGDIQGTLYCKSSTFSGRDDRGLRQDQPALAAERLQVGANIQIVDTWDGIDPDGPSSDRSRFVGGVSLADAHVRGGIIIQGGDFEGLPKEAAEASQFGLTQESEEALHGSGIQVDRGIRIAGHAMIRGTVNLEEATIEDEVRFEQILFEGGRRGQCLRLTLARIRGSLYLGSRKAIIDPAFRADRMDPADTVYLPPERPVSMICIGQVNLSGAVIEGFISLKGLHIRNPITPEDADTGVETLAVNATLAEIGKDVFVYRADPDESRIDREPQTLEALRIDPYLVTVVGPVSFEQAEIKGNLSLDHALLFSREAIGLKADEAGVTMGAALLASTAKIQRSVYFGPDFESHGEINFARADIGQSFVSEGRHHGPEEGHHAVGRNVPRALACQGIQIGVSVELRHPFAARGLTDFTQAEILSTFRSLGGRFDPSNAVAVELPGAHIGRKLIFDEETCISGDMDLTAAQIDNDLEVWRASFCRGDRPGPLPVLRARRAVVAGTLFLGYSADRDAVAATDGNGVPDHRPSGTRGYVLDLTDAVIGTLKDNAADWPNPGDLILNGFSYGRIGEGAPMDAKSRLDWLERQPEPALTDRFDPQPFDQIVHVLRQQGRPKEAEDLDVAMRDRRRRVQRRFSAMILEPISGWTMRYGYQPWRVIFGHIFFALLGTLIFAHAYSMVAEGGENADPRMVERCVAPADAEYYVGTRAEREDFPLEDYPRFHPFHFSVDLIIPIMDLRQHFYWIASSHPHCRGQTVYPAFAWGRDVRLEDNESEIGMLRLGPVRVGLVHARAEVYWIKLYQSFQIILGWIFTTLFAALITGLVRPKTQPTEGRR